MSVKSRNKVLLIAPCGMNCGLCAAFLREKNTCPGCRLFDAKEPVSIARCRIKNCHSLKKEKFRFCFECADFPCRLIKHLDKRYRLKYNMSMIENLEDIREDGLKNFLKRQARRWRCPRCGGVICVHKGYCLKCHNGNRP